MICAILLIMPVMATYAGDKPLATVYSAQENGGYVFSVGNSTYSGTLHPGDRYPVSFTIDIPEDATVRYQRYYLYWAWGRKDQQAVYPAINATQCSGEKTLTGPAVRYVDNKGFSSASDFYSGMDAFSCRNLTPGKNTVTFEVANTGEGNSTFVVQGAGVLAVYESPASPPGQIEVREGCDMLYSSYGITPEMATSRMDFSQDIDMARLSKATLELVAPSGGYTRSDIIRKNAVGINHEQSGKLPPFITSVLSLVFPETRGKEWVDVFDSDQQQQIGIETRDVTPYLAARSNFATVQDRGDYLLLTNAILKVDYT
ncbi:DUF3344 domain-containing protein [uncultured Methanoregula sp.]|uniref:DUF3344 domain-containing protein n=1 Tax=uncultured Methanoregula sp. TaxID=1005933 RepID=UPI002AAB4C0D|nr:DUF3344 domain-containing protein [uncultured Methanoregula sp.]